MIRGQLGSGLVLTSHDQAPRQSNLSKFLVHREGASHGAIL